MTLHDMRYRVGLMILTAWAACHMQTFVGDIMMETSAQLIGTEPRRASSTLIRGNAKELRTKWLSQTIFIVLTFGNG